MNTVHEVMMHEAITFGLFFLSVILLGGWFLYILKRWSWIPRKTQRKGFTERF